MLGHSTSIVIPQTTEYAKEMAKWEAFPTQWGAPGRPFTHHEYPKMLYTATHVSGKGITLTDRIVVNDEHEERNMRSRGFGTAQEAYDACQKQHTDHGKLAAEREYEIRHGHHSERAIAEVRAAEAEHGAMHLPTVPETPIPTHRKRGRKPREVTHA